MDAKKIRKANVKTYPRRYPEKRSRKKRTSSAIHAILAGSFLVMTGVFYVYAGIQYKYVFFPNTVINGIDISGMNIEQGKAAMDAGVRQYTLILEERGGKEEIHGYDIDLCTEYDGTLEGILKEQIPFAWGVHYIKGKQYERKAIISYDEKKLVSIVNSLICMDSERIINPEDAYLTYVKGSGYEIVPEIMGNALIPEKFYSEVSSAILNLEGRISLEEADVYRKPQILKDDPALKARAEAWGAYADVTVDYHFGDKRETLDGSIICQWLSDDGQGKAVLDKEKIAEYVDGLAKKYDTAYQAKKLKTAYGPVVTIKGGAYGWRINKKEETEALIKIIDSGQSQDREPVYIQRASSHGEPDYGDTYVEMNLTAQHLYFYKNGKLLVESDFVSGDEVKGWSTPPGAFPLTYKQRNATLKGKNYATPVSYWMPFNGNIGMHDAYWRSSFGGTIYKKSGSHGCVNLPSTVAKTIFENIEAGMPVLCYHLEGTEKKATTSASGEKAKKDKAVNNPATSPKETASQEVQPQETTAPAQPSLPPGPAAEIPESSSAQPETVPSMTMPGEPGQAATNPGEPVSGPG